MGEKFNAASEALETFQGDVQVVADPRAVIPERALVLELLGSVTNFEQAAQALGLEWLGSMSPDKSSPSASSEGDESQEDDEAPEGDEAQAKVFYLTMPSEQGLRSLLAAWARFTKGQQPRTTKETPLWAMFAYLKDLRTWSSQDRVDPILVRYVKARLESQPDALVAVEVDLWYRNERQRRDQALQKLKNLTKEVGGNFIDEIEIPEIQYQGVLVQMPGSVALQMINGGEVGLAGLDEIMRIRPQAAFEGDELVSLEGPQVLSENQVPTDVKCVAAILDGYPVTQHEALAGRLVVQEVDVSAAEAPAAARLHGTAMASLIVRGDLAKNELPLQSPLAVIPVLSVNTRNTETTPSGKLAIGVIYRALTALVELRKQPTSALSQVVVVNHSICDTQLPFVRATSPWASLIDYFGHHHRLLFIVSAGNIPAAIPVAGVSTMQELLALDPQVRDARVIGSLRESSGTRGLLCPAETVNGLTVGALHQDGGVGAASGTEIDPFQGLEMTSLNSALGLGVNRSVKPDLAKAGGRSSLGISTNAAGQVQVHPARSTAMGHKVARPGLGGEANRYGLSAGTSDAAALTTRSAVQIAGVLDEVFQQDGEEWSKRPTRAAILKTLLVHGARWGDVGELLYKTIMDPASPAKRQAEKNETTRYIGFGKIEADRVLDGTHNRITLLADDLIKSDERHVFKLPIPTHMLRSRDLRSITLTLSWTTPIVIFSSDYRGVGLKLVDSDGKQIFWKGVKRDEVMQPVLTAMERGTVVHMQLAGSTLWQHGKSGGHALEIGVQAMAKHGSTKGMAVPYALAMTLEVAQSVDTKIYEQVRGHIRARQQQRARTILRS
ncbi:MAG: S8 family serine peptidase [Polaromonas sp.]|nr:S8 family serine peptidase [Polaromonas sp.]